MTISKPYKHGSRWRCRTRTPEGWRWCSSADSPEGAVALAQGVRDPNLHPPAEGEVESPPALDPLLLEGPQERDAESGPGPQKSEQDGVRISNPYPHQGGFRCRISTSAGRTWAATASTEAQALKLAEAAAAKAARQGAITVKDALAAYLKYKERVGLRPASLQSIGHAVNGLLGGVLGSRVSRITPRVAQAQYDKLQQTVDPRTGRTPSVATHRMYLSLSKTFFRWVVSRGWIGANPLEAVRGEGKRRRGKLQLTFDEAHRLSLTCRREAVRGDAGATATLMALHMALRASEVLSRVVRDLDNGGTVLRIRDNDDVDFRAKTEKSSRPVKIPVFLQPILAERARGKEATDPLFPGPVSGRQHRQWLWFEVRRLCVLAGVPQVCPHSLRGVFASALASTGEAVEVVAQILGHENTSMTLNHYIAPGVSEAAQLERATRAFNQPPVLPA